MKNRKEGKVKGGMQEIKKERRKGRKNKEGIMEEIRREKWKIGEKGTEEGKQEIKPKGRKETENR